MQDNPNLWHRPEQELVDADTQFEEKPQEPKTPFIHFWTRLRRMGLGDSALRIGTITATTLMIVLVVWVMDIFYLKDPQLSSDAAGVANAEALPTPTATVPLPSFYGGGSYESGLAREADLHTVLPLRQNRFEVIEYTVESGDSIFSIAEKFSLKPESILWGNRYFLGDDPHFILPGQKLFILPVDGVYHQWSTGESLSKVAEVYGVTPEDIIEWPSNDLDADEIGDYSNPNIPENTLLVVPGGKGEFTDWRTPRISRDEPATAKNLGPGACTGSYDGIMGSLTFIWPTTERYLSGYDYSPETNHFGIDIAGDLGNPIFAADHGVVVYAGWNDYGYGEMVVIDHGSGWHLSGGYYRVDG